MAGFLYERHVNMILLTHQQKGNDMDADKIAAALTEAYHLLFDAKDALGPGNWDVDSVTGQRVNIQDAINITQEFIFATTGEKIRRFDGEGRP